MKKKLKIIFFFFLFLIIPKNIQAYVNEITDNNKFIYYNEIKNNSYLAVCSYTHIDNKSRYERINIYHINDNRWVVAWDDISSSKIITKNDSIDKIFTESNNIFMSNLAKEVLLDEGLCPEKAYIDVSGIWGGNEVCFGDKEYCKDVSNFATSFAAGDVTSNLNYEIYDDLEQYFVEWHPHITSCEDLRNKTLDVQGSLKNDFIKNFMHDRAIPSFIINSDPYGYGMINLEQKFKEEKEQCDEEIDEDATLSASEKIRLKRENQEGLNYILGEIDSTQNNIKDKEENNNISGNSNSNEKGEDKNDNGDNSSSSLKEPPNYHVTDDASVGGLCNMSQYRKIARFLGTIVTFFKIIVPLIIIVFGVIDLYKAITGAKDDAIKKSAQSIMVRVVAGVLVFLLPGIIQMILNMVNEWSNYKNDWCCCTDCILNSNCNINSCSSNSCHIEGTN